MTLGSRTPHHDYSVGQGAQNPSYDLEGGESLAVGPDGWATHSPAGPAVAVDTGRIGCSRPQSWELTASAATTGNLKGQEHRPDREGVGNPGESRVGDLRGRGEVVSSSLGLTAGEFPYRPFGEFVDHQGRRPGDSTGFLTPSLALVERTCRPRSGCHEAVALERRLGHRPPPSLSWVCSRVREFCESRNV